MYNDNSIATESNAYEALRTAQYGLDLPLSTATMLSSAKVCLDDATSFFNNGQYGYSLRASMTSLRYSCGLFDDRLVVALAVYEGRASFVRRQP